MPKRERRTYMLDKLSINTLKEIMNSKGKLTSLGLYFKSQSDIINHSIMKFSEFLKNS